LWDRDSGAQTIYRGRPFGISDNGYIIGNFGVWKNGSIIDIGTLGGRTTNAYAISSGGKIAGKSQISTGEWHAFIWDEVGGMRDLGVINGDIISVNDNDEIASQSRPVSQIMHSFFWNETHGMIDIGTLGGSCYASDLNIHGQMTGSSGGSHDRPYLWEDRNNNGISDTGELISLGTLGHPGCYGQGMNDNGQVVGYSDVPNGLHGFIWDELNGMIDLNDGLAEEDGWEFHHAFEINNYGEIIGYASDPNNNDAVVLLTPVPETVDAKIEIKPNTLNPSSKGRWITSYIWLPEGYDVADVNSYSVFLEDEIGAEWIWADEEGQVVMAKFSRSALQEMLAELETPTQVELLVTGELADGTIFEGTDTIKVIDKGNKK
jgi:probable HAF family extracellular repeat protein